MIGPFTNDFVGGVLASIVLVLATGIVAVLWLGYRDRPLDPVEKNPPSPPEPPSPALLAIQPPKDINEEWAEVDR